MFALGVVGALAGYFAKRTPGAVILGGTIGAAIPIVAAAMTTPATR
jgi:hypothetical protein